MPKVSVVVPIYGVENYIERCARSLFEQTLDDVEYIFVNDCTKDHSIEILMNIIQSYQSIKSKVNIINHKNNMGLAYARKTGLLASTGDYILNVDSDDYLEPNALNQVISRAEIDNADIVYFDYYRCYEDNKRVVKQIKIIDNIEYIDNILQLKLAASVWNKLIRRNLYIQNNIFPIQGINSGEDLVTTVPLIYRAHKISYIDKPLYNYVYNPSSYINNINKKSFEDILFVVNSLNELFKDNPFLLKSLEIYKYKQKSLMLLNSNRELANEYQNLFKSIDVDSNNMGIYRFITLFNKLKLQSLTRFIIRIYNLIIK